MIRVKIYGAGSIGNHLAYACRNKNWDVTLCDIDEAALTRTKMEIYPDRYGHWDSDIKLSTDAETGKEKYDLVIIGTPPDTHMKIAKEVLDNAPPKALLIEKPVCTPSMEGARYVLRRAQETGTIACVGYNHTLTKNTLRAEALIRQGVIGTPLSISAKFREHWGGIFNAHPWLSGPEDTYLGFYERGGGASGEHSHAINIWQHFAALCGFGKISKVSALLDMVNENEVKYDRICLLNVETENGHIGDIAQDVITEPAQKSVRIQGDQGYVEWICNFDSGNDAINYRYKNGEIFQELIPKERPDDFKGEIDYVEKLITTGDDPDSPISLRKGLETMLVIAAAHDSNENQKSINIDYNVLEV